MNEVAKVIPLHADARARSTRDRPVDPRPSRPAADPGTLPEPPFAEDVDHGTPPADEAPGSGLRAASPVRWPVPQSSRAVGWPATTR
ncbi:hypothetical protein GS880_09760 [Rhodococcus hoagii]|nr:hypothetical protein [Prescottella equi]